MFGFCYRFCKCIADKSIHFSSKIFLTSQWYGDAWRFSGNVNSSERDHEKSHLNFLHARNMYFLDMCWWFSHRNDIQ